MFRLACLDVCPAALSQHGRSVHETLTPVDAAMRGLLEIRSRRMDPAQRHAFHAIIDESLAILEDRRDWICALIDEYSARSDEQDAVEGSQRGGGETQPQLEAIPLVRGNPGALYALGPRVEEAKTAVRAALNVGGVRADSSPMCPVQPSGRARLLGRRSGPRRRPSLRQVRSFRWVERAGFGKVWKSRGAHRSVRKSCRLHALQQRRARTSNG